jgi:hypothetical protein
MRGEENKKVGQLACATRRGERGKKLKNKRHDVPARSSPPQLQPSPPHCILLPRGRTDRDL